MRIRLRVFTDPAPGRENDPLYEQVHVLEPGISLLRPWTLVLTGEMIATINRGDVDVARFVVTADLDGMDTLEEVSAPKPLPPADLRALAARLLELANQAEGIQACRKCGLRFKAGRVSTGFGEFPDLSGCAHDFGAANS